MEVSTKQISWWWVAVGFAIILHLFLVRQGWESERLIGQEFRQTQTAITAHFIQQEQNFALAYPTPVLGKPWSIPYEFPLYQWTVVKISDLTGWSLVSAARAVTLLCLYLTLPAIAWLAVRYSGMPAVGPLTLLFVLTCPLYIFYARSFLIDMMALMCSVWFAVGLLRVQEGAPRVWLIIANLAGLAAGVVKITTLMVVAVPLGVYILTRIRREGWTREVAKTVLLRWSAVALLPMAGTWAWLRFSDQVKARNPQGESMTSENLGDFIFGDLQDRLDPQIWIDQWHIIATNVIDPWLAVFLLVGAVGFLGRSNWKMLGAVAMFTIGPVVFPRLYAIHEYYFIAVSTFVALALAIGVGQLTKYTRSSWLVGMLVLAIVGVQLRIYGLYLYPDQYRVLPGTDGMSELIMASSDPDDVLIIAGNDWAPMLPYACQRRALMVRSHAKTVTPPVMTSLDNLRHESIGAFVVWKESGEFTALHTEVTSRFNLWPTPVFQTKDYMVWADREHRLRMMTAMKSKIYAGVELSIEASLEFNDLPSIFQRVSGLEPSERERLQMVGPKVQGIDGDYPIVLMDYGGRPVLGAHPKQRVRLESRPGLMQLALEFGFLPTAHDSSQEHPTDGVGFSVITVDAFGQTRHHWRRLVSPALNSADRGPLTQELEIRIQPGETLWLQTDAGNDGDLSFDWVYWSKIDLS